MSKRSKPINSLENIDPFFIHYLSNIGIKSNDDVMNFFFPQLSHLPDPFTMDQLDETAGLIVDWIIKKKPFLIWGDYDVDGITGSSILYLFLDYLDCNVICHIPDRISEGYGLNNDTLERYAEDLSKKECLLITVDCGMSNKAEIKRATELGFTSIITDHHEPGDHVPENCYILNGKKEGSGFDSHNLSGVGTVFFLLIGLRKKLIEKKFFKKPEQIPNLKQFLALTALGTVADMMPMTATNRILVKAGFEVMSDVQNQSVGLRKLLEALDLETGVNSVDEISFKLAPVINAAGRIGDPQKAFTLLTTNDEEVADRLVSDLVLLNSTRKELSKRDFDHALQTIAQTDVENDKCLILHGNYHQGLTGIIASKLVEKYRVPTIVFAETQTDNETILKGSCRSIDGINILKLVEYAGKFTLKFGGHQGAAGVSIKKSNFEAFKYMVRDGVLSGQCVVPKRKKSTPYEIPLDQAFTKSFLDGLSLLEPTGEGVPRPEFVDPEASVVHCKHIGKENEHLQVVFRGKMKNHRGVGFYQGQALSLINQGNTCKLTYTPYRNKFNKIESWQVMITSISESDY